MPHSRNGDGDGLAVYVHWPFCLSKCPYCDFNSHVAGEIDQARWRRALTAEIDQAAERLPDPTVTSIFFGGGTPSLMPPATVATVIDTVAARWSIDRDVEITLEANPTSVEAGAFADIARAGVNRISLGIQALDDAALGFLGREHTTHEALDAVATAQRAVTRTSFDLIYGRPGQTVDAWGAELAQALDHAGSHISAYQLTIEKGTPFFAAHRDGAFTLPDDDTAFDLYEVTHSVLDEAGLPAYEISNHARPGEECRHNLAYWRYQNYVGVGPGAHGRIQVDGVIRATENRPAPGDWLDAVERAGHGARRDEPVSRDDAAVEALMMGLRLTAGIDRSRFRARTGLALEQTLDKAALERLVEAGLLEIDKASLRTTAQGRPLLNAILERLIPLHAAA
jgi:oxygen-independent coproporphyrinogen-3 oxidase